MTTTYRIVVGVDGSEGGERALRWAVHEAAGRPAATVLAVTAYSTDTSEGSSLWYREQRKAMAEEMLGGQIVRALANNPRVAVTTRVVQGSAVEALLDSARGAHLLVLGSHGHGRLYHAVLGSVAQECVRDARCPVVVVPAPAREKVAPASAPDGIPAAIL
ncbi:MAG TPA: universal stress protein [Rugosimonospora sp.]|nr:universal stress protein [Rugosimonospora sp.]